MFVPRYPIDTIHQTDPARQLRPIGYIAAAVTIAGALLVLQISRTVSRPAPEVGPVISAARADLAVPR